MVAALPHERGSLRVTRREIGIYWYQCPDTGILTGERFILPSDSRLGSVSGITRSLRAVISPSHMVRVELGKFLRVDSTKKIRQGSPHLFYYKLSIVVCIQAPFAHQGRHTPDDCRKQKFNELSAPVPWLRYSCILSRWGS